jgi:hypothetical protein
MRNILPRLNRQSNIRLQASPNATLEFIHFGFGVVITNLTTTSSQFSPVALPQLLSDLSQKQEYLQGDLYDYK